MKQSKRLISERRVRAAIFAAYDEHNPGNKPKEISKEVINSLDAAVQELITDMVYHAVIDNGRLNHSGRFSVDYWGGV